MVPAGQRVRRASVNPCRSFEASATKASSTSSVATMTRGGGGEPAGSDPRTQNRTAYNQRCFCTKVANGF